MVRLKNRYMLVNILYPEIDTKASNAKVPDVVTFHKPTTNELTPGVLLRGLKKEVDMLFGDYGAGTVAESLSVKYLSPATSTFILRVSRAHYSIAWAALTCMTRIPVRDGKNCVFRVVRVSGTIRKAEEEAVRRARELILKAQRTMDEREDSTLDSIFGKGKDQSKDILMVDKSDSEEDEEPDDEGLGYH